MSTVVIQVDKSDLDGNLGAYRCSTYNSIDDSKSKHARFAFAVDMLSWVDRQLQKYPGSEAWYTSRGSYSGNLADVRKRWSQTKSPKGEHPADTEWRNTLKYPNPDRLTPNRVYRGPDS